MSQIFPLRDAQITNGNVINADDLDAEYNQLVSESNAQDTRLTAIESGAVTLQGVKTFTSAPKLDSLEERTLGQGISAENVVFKAGSVQFSATILISGVDITTNKITTNQSHNITTATGVRIQASTTLPSPLVATTTYFARAVSATEITLHPTATDASNNTNTVDLTTTGSGTLWVLADPPSPQNGQVWHSAVSNSLKARLNGQTTTVLTAANGIPAQSYIGTLAPLYNAANSIVLPAGFQAFDKTGSLLMTVASNQTVQLNTSGANGLDAGSEAANTWYYLYLIGDSTGVNASVGLLSTVNESVSGSIALPTGYDRKRQLPLALRNDASSNLIPFAVAEGWPTKPVILYKTNLSVHAGGATTAGATNVLAAGTAASFTSVSATSYVPPLSRCGLLYSLSTFANSAYARVREATGLGDQHAPGGGAGMGGQFIQTLTSAQAFEYYRASGTGSVNIDVAGYIVTEL